MKPAALREAAVGIVYGPASVPGLQGVELASGRLVCVSRQRVGRAATVTLQDQARQPFVRIDDRDPPGA